MSQILLEPASRSYTCACFVWMVTQWFTGVFVATMIAPAETTAPLLVLTLVLALCSALSGSSLSNSST